jgi:hypothetical protein
MVLLRCSTCINRRSSPRQSGLELEGRSGTGEDMDNAEQPGLTSTSSAHSRRQVCQSIQGGSQSASRTDWSKGHMGKHWQMWRIVSRL